MWYNCMKIPSIFQWNYNYLSFKVFCVISNILESKWGRIWVLAFKKECRVEFDSNTLNRLGVKSFVQESVSVTWLNKNLDMLWTFFVYYIYIYI